MRVAGNRPSRATLAPLPRSLLAAALMCSALSAHPQEAGVYEPAPASPALDSLSLRLIDIAIDGARLEMSQSDLPHRLMPSVALTGSVGTQAVFTDELGYGIASPRLACRLTVTIALGEILNPSRYNRAALDLARLECGRKIARARILQRDTANARRLHLLRAELTVAGETLGLKERMLAYCRLRFEQGAGSYAELSRAQIDCLEWKARCDRLTLEIQQLEGAER